MVKYAIKRGVRFDYLLVDSWFIACFTLTMMQYNILCYVKRFEAYETIGGLFAEVTKGSEGQVHWFAEGSEEPVPTIQ